ncbi:MAG: hypothetical protein J6B12_06105 [Clostridia bacterium]|nr:hypothetical protein [Clostridia bacterium]
MKKLGYAVLGLGIGMAHAEAAAASEYADLIAVCDINEKRLEKKKKEIFLNEAIVSVS